MNDRTDTVTRIAGIETHTNVIGEGDAHRFVTRSRAIQRAKLDVVAFEEDGRTAEEWLYARKATLAELRKFDEIPQELIDMVDQFNEHAVVKPFVDMKSQRVGVELKQTKPDPQKFMESMAAFHRTQNRNGQRWTASEALSFVLRRSLRALKSAEKKRKPAPVRASNLVPRSLIARTAMYLLEACERDHCSPGVCLGNLLRELLNVHAVKRWIMYRAQDRKFFSLAVYVIAQVPTMGTRELARIMHVDPSTVSRWRHSKEFETKVEEMAEQLAATKPSQRLDKNKFLSILPEMVRRELPLRLAGSIPCGRERLDFFEESEMPAAGWWEALWPDPAGVLRAVGVGRGMDVIDLCSGDGWFTLQIARIAKRVAAIEIEPAVLETARHRLTEGGLTNCDYITGDAYDVATLAPWRADFVFIGNTLHGVPDRPRLATAVRTALKPTGRFAVVNWQPRPREETTVLGLPRGPSTELRMSPEQTIEEVEAGGLKLDRVLDLPPYHYAVIFRNPRL